MCPWVDIKERCPLCSTRSWKLQVPSLPCVGPPTTASPPGSFSCLMSPEKDMKIAVMTNTQIRLTVLLWGTAAALKALFQQFQKAYSFSLEYFLQKNNDPSFSRHHPFLRFLQNFSSTRCIWCPCKWKVKVAQLCSTLCSPMDYTVHGIF